MAKPLLVIHGALGSVAQLEPLLGELRRSAPKPYEVHAVELPGHGATAADEGQYRIDRFAERIREFISSNELDAPLVFGYSMGGYVALHLASELPDLLSGVITLGTKLAWSPEVAAKEVSRLDPTTIRRKVPKFAEALEARHRGAGGWEFVLARTAALMTTLGNAPPIDSARLARIRTRTRLMVGDRDIVVSVAETADAAHAISGADYAVLPGTPHPIEQVRIALVVQMIHDFAQ